MKSKATVCDYCGEPSKWGYYRFDGRHVCDDCGDFVLHVMESNGSLQAMVSASRLDECTQKLHGHPTLPGKVNSPLKDLLVGVAPGKHDVIIFDAGSQHDGVIVNPAKHRKFFTICHKIGSRFFVLISHMCVAIGVKISLPNVKAHLPLGARANVERGVEVVITENHVNRAAPGGWMQRLVRLIL